MSQRSRFAVLLVILILIFAGSAKAQYSDQQPAQTSAPADEEKSKTPDPGIIQPGPNKGVGETVIVPRDRPARAPARAAKPADRPAGQDETFVFRADVPVVSLSIVVQDDKGNFLIGLKQENFRIAEDNVLQKIDTMETIEAPMTVVLLMEFSDLYWEFLEQTFNAAYTFVSTLQPEDWIAVIVYDLRPHILTDFTRDKGAALGALNSLSTFGFSETNLFDALTDTLQRMESIEGQKAILLISSGVDTFSRTRYDKTLKLVQESSTPIYSVGTGQIIREMYDARGYMDSVTRMKFLQADNQLRSFSKLSGGRAFFPRFDGQFPSIYNEIAATLRNEYTIAYTPTNQAKDGTFRKIKVELLDLDGKPLKIADEKGKEIKYKIQVKEGYYAPRAVE